MPVPSSDLPMTTQSLTAALEDDIIAGRLASGQKLASERKLADSHRVSRPVVREALRRLQERGLIVVHPGRGSFVRQVLPTAGHSSLDVLVRRGVVTVRELVVARQMLETEAAALAASHRTADDIERMRTLLQAFDASTDLATGADLDIAFHEAIVLASKNTVLQIMFGAIRPLTRGMVLRSLTDRETRRAGAPVHHHVLDAIEAGDGVGAREAMRRHLRLAEEMYGQDIDRPLHQILYRQASDLPELAALLRQAGDSVAP